MKKKLLSLAILFVFLPLGMVYAQQGSLSGEVVSASTDEALAGANIYITQLQRGASTDIDGQYEIQNIQPGTYRVRVSYIGFRTIERNIEISSGSNTLNFELEEGQTGFEELIVSGYSVTPRRELTGSISSVRAQDIETVPLQNAEGFLQGRAAGVNVTSASGNPGGAFRVAVRGNGSINSASEPLYIIDGVQMSFSQLSQEASTSPLNSLNPQDIESIEVLKDASSAAIYGAQAAAGVVIITTKRGQAGRTQIRATAETGVRQIARLPNYINQAQHLEFMGEARYNQGLSTSVDDGIAYYEGYYAGFFGTPNNDGVLAYTDWQDFIFSEGVAQKYNISVSGGDETTRFYLSGGFEDTEGTVYNTDFTRLNLRTNLDHQINERFNTSLSLNVARSTQFGVCQGGNYVNCPPSQSMLESPFAFPFLANGDYNPNMNLGGMNVNPAVVRDEVDRDVSITTITSSLSTTFLATNWLSFTGRANIDYRDTEDSRFDSRIANAAVGGSLSYAYRRVTNYNTSLTANMYQTFDGVHNLSGLLGTEYRNDYSQSVLTTGQGFPIEYFRVLSASSNPTNASGTNSEWRLGSYFANAKYNYDERYFLSLVGRYDGHSRFGADTRWGFFPSISGAWRISEEAFFPETGVIDELKFRAGYGTTGNSNIGNFSSRGLFSTLGSYQGLTAIAPNQLSNVGLGWEEASEINLGLDYELFRGRISGSIDVYQKDNNELLLAVQLPGDSGFTSYDDNIGSVRNRGVELEINSVNVDFNNFMWSTRFNVGFIDNEILSLPNGESIRPDNWDTSLQEGQPIGLIQVPRWAGVNPADGRPMWYDADGELTYTPTQSRDKVNYKDGLANTVGGIGNTLSYRGFTLDAFFNFSFGQWALASTDYYFTRTGDYWASTSAEVLDRWRQPGDFSYYPAAATHGGAYVETNDYRTQLGTQAINNASYIRLKNLSASYNLPASVTNSLNIGNIRLFATGVNLLTFTAWPWYDPEVAFDATDIYGNLTTASYPTERQFNVGIDIQF